MPPTASSSCRAFVVVLLHALEQVSNRCPRTPQRSKAGVLSVCPCSIDGGWSNRGAPELPMTKSCFLAHLIFD